MAIINTSTQAIKKPDVFDVLMGGDQSWDPSATPLFSQGRKGPDTPDATLFQFPYDLPDDPTNTGAAEGGRYSQAGTTSYGYRALLYGRMHHLKNYFGVGEVAQGNVTYGTNGADEFTYQMRRALRQQVKSMEYIGIGIQESQAGNGSTTFTTRGLELWITETASISAQTDSQTQVPANFRPASGQVATISISGGDYTLVESDVNNVFNTVYGVLKDKIDYQMWCTTAFKTKVSQWGNLVTVSGQAAQRRFDQSLTAITATIDTYTGDAGKAEFELHPWLRFTTTQKAEAIGLDKRFWEWRVRQQPKARRLPDQGGGAEGVCETTMGIQCMPKYHAKWKRND